MDYDDPYAQHEGAYAYGMENEFGEFVMQEAVDETGRGPGAGVGVNKFDRAGDQPLRVARLPGEFRRPRRRDADEDAPGDLYVGDVVGGAQPAPRGQALAARRAKFDFNADQQAVKLTERDLRRLVEAAANLLATDGLAPSAPVHQDAGVAASAATNPLAAAARAWRIADRRGVAAAVAKPRRVNRPRDDITHLRAETLARFDEALARFDDLVSARAAEQWSVLVGDTPAAFSMNMRFLAAAFTWIYVHFDGATSLAGRTEDLNAEFAPRRDARLREIAKRAKQGDPTDDAQRSDAAEPRDLDYLVIFAYVVWLKHLQDGDYSAAYEYDDAPTEAGQRPSSSAPRAFHSRVVFTPLDTPYTRLVKAADALGETHLSKTFLISGPDAAPPPRLREFVSDVRSGNAGEMDLAPDVARAIRDSAVLIGETKIAAGRRGGSGSSSMFDAGADAPESETADAVYFGGLAATIAAIRAVLAREPRLGEARSVAEGLRIANTKVAELFEQAFLPLSAAGAIGRDFIGEFAAHVPNPTVAYALVRYAARADVREIALGAGAAFSTVTDAFLGEGEFAGHAATLRRETEAERSRISESAVLARARSDVLYHATPVPLTKPRIEASAPEIVFETERTPIEIFARAKPTATVPLIQFFDSEAAAASRESLRFTPEFFTSYVIDALASEAQNREPTGWGLSARRAPAGQLRPHTKILAGESQAALRAIVSAARAPRAVMPPRTISFVMRTRDEELAVFSLVPTRGGVRLAVHSVNLTESELAELVQPAVAATFPGLAPAGAARATPGGRSERIRGRFSVVGPAAEILSVPGFYFSVMTLPALKPFFSINEVKRPLSEKPMAPLFHIFGGESDGRFDADDEDAVQHRTRARIRFETQELVRAAPGRPTATLPVTFFVHTASDVWFVAYVVSLAVGLYASAIAEPLTAILSKITPGVFSPAGVGPPPSSPDEEDATAIEPESSQPNARRRSHRAPTAVSRETIPRKISDLRANTEPGTVVANYDSLCACKNQPVLITEDERAAWNGHDVLEYKNRLLVCPDPKMPYPIVKPITKSKIAGNLDKDFPCCFVRPARGSRPLAGAEAEADAVVIGRAGYVITKATAVEIGRRGILPSGFLRLLKSVTDDDGSREFARVGTLSKSPNSLIHAVLTALDINGYNTEGSLRRREAAAEFYRAKMRALPASVYAQEFPDLDPAGARRRRRVLADAVAASFAPSRALDSKLHIRGLEAVFDAHIFVVEPAADRTGAYEFEIPNHAGAHLFPPLRARSRTLILVRISNVPAPHYEPVVSFSRGDANAPAVPVFTESVARLMAAVVERTLETVRVDAASLSFEKDYPFGVDLEATLAAPGAIFVRGAKIDGIHLDAYGKMRAIEVSDPAGAVATVFTPPLAPVSAPIADDPLDGEPSLAGRRGPPAGMVVAGAASSERAPSAPIKVAVAEGSIELVVAANSNKQHPENAGQEFLHRERLATLIVQFAHWARMVARATAGRTPLLPLAEWWQLYVVADDKFESEVPPSAVANSARAEFPDMRATTADDRTAAAVSALGAEWPDFVRGGKLRVPSVETSRRLFRFLHRVERETLGLEDNLDDPFGMVPRFVIGVFSRVPDFCIGASHDEILAMRVFITPESFNDWLAHARGVRDDSQIVAFGSDKTTPLQIVLEGSARGGAHRGAFLAEISNGGVAVVQTHPGAHFRDAARAALKWPPLAPRPALWVVTKAREIVPADAAESGAGVLRLDAGEPQLRGAFASILPLALK